VSFEDLMPYAASTCLDCHSESAVPGSASSINARATFAAFSGATGAWVKGERCFAANRQ